jgi:HEAT repeat protein
MRRAVCLFLTLLVSGIGPAVADTLRTLPSGYQSRDAEAMLKALAELGQSGDIAALPPLLEALRDERAVVRQYAVEALQRFARVLDDAHILVKRWLQILINRLRTDSADERIIVEAPDIHACVAPMGAVV